MTAGMAADTPAQRDARWVEGMAHLQEGRWKDAVRCFEGLAKAYPDDAAARRALDEAELRAAVDSRGRVRAKRWIVPWRAIVVRLLIVAALAFLAFGTYQLIINQVLPWFDRWQEEREQDRIRRDAIALFEAGDLDGSEAKWDELLVRVPGDPEALDYLERIEDERDVQSLYDAAVAAQETGDRTSALEQLTDLQVLRPGYRDVGQRIAQIQRQQQVEEAAAQASAAYEAGRTAEALAAYEQLRALDIGYQTALVQERLYTLHLRRGQELLDQRPPATERVAEALEHFEQALVLKPGDGIADQERRLAQSFLDGQERYRAGDWKGAVGQLRAVYLERPDYLGGLVVSMLYEAYISYGDLYKDGPSQDCAFAFEQYDLASRLPVEDTQLAERRKVDVDACRPPTPTPSNTPTLTPTPTPTLPPTITPIPTETPIPPTPTPRTLTAFHNQILFKQVDDSVSEYSTRGDAVATLWVMNPDGTNRRPLGPYSQYKGQFEALYAQYARSPDGRYRAFTNDRDQIAIELPPSSEWPPGTAQQLTHFTGICYHPQWSPDGGRIVFVSDENEGDDIWVMSANGRNARWLLRNTWEWEKHPSWSPDSRRIAFWSNQNGLAQIYVMDDEGRYPTNISQQSEHNEWDPIWVR